MISVLYVDDEVQLLSLCKIFLERSGEIIVTPVDSAKKALDIIKKQSFDVILSDYQMPEMDGIVFLKEIRDQGNRTPFIVFTGRGREEIVIQAINYGADFYLQKGGDPKSQFAELQSKIIHAYQRKKAETSLNTALERYETIIGTLPDLLFELDSDKKIVDYRCPAQQKLYAPPEMFIGKSQDELLPPQPAEIINKAIDRASVNGFDTGAVYALELDGKIQWFELSIAPIREFEGMRNGFIVLSRDITERKDAEIKLIQSYEDISQTLEKLKRSEEARLGYVQELEDAKEKLQNSEIILSAIIQDSPIPQFVIDKNHLVIHWNKALAEHSGIAQDSIIGTNNHWKAFYESNRPCLADLLLDNREDLVEIWYEGKYRHSPLIEGAFEVTDFFPRLGDKGTWLYFTAAVIRDRTGNPLGAVETLENVTEQKDYERMLKDSYEDIAAALEEVRNSEEILSEYVHELEIAKNDLMKNELMLSAILKESPIPQFVINEDHIVVHWNRALEVFSSIPAEKVIGTNEHWKAFYEKQRPCIADLLLEGKIDEIDQWFPDSKRREIHPGVYEITEIKHISDDKTVILHAIAARVITPDGSCIGAVESIEDVTHIIS